MPGICVIGEADPFLARLLQRFAAEIGLEAVRADDGEGVLGLARTLRPTVIILEPDLPGALRGWQAAEVLAADQDLCRIPIVTCSWLPDRGNGTGFATAAGHLHKPDLHYEDFLAALAAAGVVTKGPGGGDGR